MGTLSDKRLVVVSGKGGVGKTTVAAALALGSARAGRKTLVCEVNTTERVSALLGRPPVGPEIGLLEENLWAVDVRPPEAMREYALMILKFESIYNAVFENRLVRYFLRFIPSLQELVMLGKILFHLRETQDKRYRFDQIIVDAPATGHAISFLRVAQVILDTVPPGPLSREAETMRDLLVDPAITAAVLVSLPEELPVSETLELAAALRSQVHIAPQAAVLNCVIGPRFAPAELRELKSRPALETLAQHHAQRAALSQQCHERLTRGLNLPVYPVPRLFLPGFGRPAIEQITHHLEPLWGKP